jgi:hypothetical protein
MCCVAPESGRKFAKSHGLPKVSMDGSFLRTALAWAWAYVVAMTGNASSISNTDDALVSSSIQWRGLPAPVQYKGYRGL